MMNLSWNEAQNYISSKGTYLVVFKTGWCPDCRIMEVLLSEWVQEFREEGLREFSVINIDAEEANLYKGENNWKVMKVPSFYIIKDGVQEHIGYEFVPREAIEKALKKALKVTN